MHRVPYLALFVTALLLLVSPSLRAAEHVVNSRHISLQSLLNEMVDRSVIAKLPTPFYTLKQCSSHDISKRDPGDPATWHSNHDYEQFLRTEVNEGRREWVILDAEGPGAITRFWLPLNADHDKQVIRFYLDGSPTPALTAKFNDLLAGRGVVPPPFAFVAWNDTDVSHQKLTAPKEMRGVAGDLYLPIPFASHCKITLDEIPFYYIIDYRAYSPGTHVETFSLHAYEAAKATLDRVGAVLTAPTESTRQGSAVSAALEPNAAQTLPLESGAHAVHKLQIHIDPKEAADALRSTIVEATFDNEQTVWCPLSELFGTGPRLHAVHDWYRSVSEDGALTAFWVMPYQHSGSITLRNLGSKTVHYTLSAVTEPWRWDEESLHFHANWRCEPDLKTRPRSDWNYIAIQGQGVYVGDTLSVFSPVGDWYGEGDERIYIDGETFPSQIGTGTEDYYGYAWGMATYFSSPFLSAPQRDVSDRGDWRGYTTTSRLRLLDGIPLRSSLKVDMEIWNWADTHVDYAVATFWYARPGATHNRTPQPREATLAIHSVPALPGAVQIAGAIECETMQIAAISPGAHAEIQNAGLKEGGWSGGKQLFVRGSKVGDYVDLVIPVPDNQPHRVVLYGTKSYDYAVLSFKFNGVAVGKNYDAYGPVPVATGPIDLGVVSPKDGKILFHVEIAGSNPAARSTGSYFGLDCVVLQQP